MGLNKCLTNFPPDLVSKWNLCLPQDLIQEVADVVVAELLRAEQLEEVALHVRLHEVQILQERNSAREETKKGLPRLEATGRLFSTPGTPIRYSLQIIFEFWRRGDFPAVSNLLTSLQKSMQFRGFYAK